MEIAIATLVTDRALLLIGEPGTAKSWLSEHLTAAINGDSTKVIQGTAGTTEEHIRYSWNYAMLIAQGPSREAMIKSPVYLSLIHIYRSTNTSTTQEKDSGGGTRDVTNNQIQENTILAGSGSGSSTNAPIVEKELSPEISGIIISAEGGGSPTVKAEISEAMEALFGLPAHKIKVLKRVE